MIQARHLHPTDLAGLRWRGYVRESTEEQTDRGTPPARQKADILRSVEELGMVGEPFWYERSGSGEKESAELQQALADAGQYDVLVAFATSRFARNRAEAVRMKAAFAKAGTIVYFASDRIISGARETRLTEGIKEVVDEEENQTRRHWVAGGMRERQLSGRWVGAIPYGYRRQFSDNPDGSRSWNGVLGPDPTESAIVERIFTEALVGRSLGEIANDLSAEGIRNRDHLWRKHAIWQMIHNPIYAGRLTRYRKTVPTHYYPEDDPRDGRQDVEVPWALVTREAWDAAQASYRPRNAFKPRRYPLSGVLRCAECGGKMTGASNTRGARYYRCSTRADSGQCSAPGIRAQAVEEAFASWIGSCHLPSDWREAIVKQREPTVERNHENLSAYLGRINKLYRAGDMEWEEYVTERDRTREKLADKAIEPSELEKMASLLGDLGSLWSADPRPALPLLVLDRMVVRQGKVEGWEVRASVRPLLEVCGVAAVPRVYSGKRYYTPLVRYV